MNKSDNMENDILGKYINPEYIEKAPEGLTEKIMTRIQVGTAPLKTAGKSRFNIMVPAVSIAITAILIVISTLFSTPSEIPSLSVLTKYFSNIDFTFPGLKDDSLSTFSPHTIFIYIALALFILAIFDRALNSFFRGHRK